MSPARRRGVKRALGMAGVLLAASCARHAPLAPVQGMPVVRVGIVVDQPEGELSATGQYRVLGPEGDILAVVDAGVSWRVAPGGAPDRLTLIRPDRPAPVDVAQPVTLRPDRPEDLVVIGGRKYRGGYVTSDHGDNAMLTLDGRGFQTVLLLAEGDGSTTFRIWDRDEGSVTMGVLGTPFLNIKRKGVPVFVVPPNNSQSKDDRPFFR